jgi:hypothetical protein
VFISKSPAAGDEDRLPFTTPMLGRPVQNGSRMTQTAW